LGRFLQRVVAEDRDGHRRVAQILAAAHARDREEARRDRVALHHRKHRFGDDAFQEAVHPFETIN